MNKCCCDDYASPIDDGIAREDLESYRKDGPSPTTRMLLEMVEGTGADGATVLDIGGGIGVIGHELLRAGAASAVLVEASPPYLDVARDEARGAELGERLTIVAGDFVRRSADIAPADIVTLDKVICCYPDVDELVAASAVRANRLYALVLPRARWYVGWIMAFGNIVQRLRRDAFRAFAHSNDRIDEQLAATGLALKSEAFTLWWRVALYERVDAGTPAQA